jgi:hypothetical protein
MGAAGRDRLIGRWEADYQKLDHRHRLQYLSGSCARATLLSSEYKFHLLTMAQFLRNEEDAELEQILESDSKETISFEHGSGHDNITGILVVSSRLSRIQKEPHVNKDSTSNNAFLFFMEVIQLLIAETNKYYNQYLYTLYKDSRCSKLPHMTVQEIWHLVTIIKMRHHVRDTVKDFWSALEVSQNAKRIVSR